MALKRDFAAATAISLENVSKTWPPRRRLLRIIQPATEVVRDVSFAVPEGSVFALLGENGAGKTTVLKMVAGLAREDSGDIALFGDSNRDRLRETRRQSVGYAGGERGFYARLTVDENLAFFGRLDGFTGAQLRRRIRDVLRIVDVEAQQARRFADLSTGLRQRVSLARVLLKNPAVLLLDEPTRTLDPFHAESIRVFVRDRLVKQEGKTVLLATNSLEEAYSIADEAGVLRNRALVPLVRDAQSRQWPNSNELFRDPAHA